MLQVSSCVFSSSANLEFHSSTLIELCIFIKPSEWGQVTQQSQLSTCYPAFWLDSVILVFKFPGHSRNANSWVQPEPLELQVLVGILQANLPFLIFLFVCFSKQQTSIHSCCMKYNAVH